MESRSHNFGLGGASDFAMKWEPKPGYSTVGEKATKPPKERRVRIVRWVEVFSMIAFVVVCTVAGLAALLAVRLTCAVLQLVPAS